MYISLYICIYILNMYTPWIAGAQGVEAVHEDLVVDDMCVYIYIYTNLCVSLLLSFVLSIYIYIYIYIY